MTLSYENQDKTKKTNIRSGYQYQPNCIYGRTFIDHYMRDVWQYLNSCKDSFKTSKATICEWTGLSKRKVDSVIRNLEKHNLIKVKRTRDGKVNFTNGYELLHPKEWGGSAHGALGVVHDMHQGGAQNAPEVVHEVHPKKTKEKTNKNTNVEAPPVDNSAPPIPGPIFDHIFERYIDPIHPWASKEELSQRNRFYTNLLIKNQDKTINTLETYARKLRNGRDFHVSVRVREERLIFDTEFKMQFEKDMKNEER